LDLVGILFPHINNDARSESLQSHSSIYLPTPATEFVHIIVMKVNRRV